MNPVIFSIFLGTMTVTAYRSIPSQTDSSPLYTSTYERVHRHGAAISQDLLCKQCRKLHRRCLTADQELDKIHYGDLVIVDDIGFKIINDTMNPKNKHHLDLWVATKEEEHKIFKKFGFRPVKVWKINYKKE